MVVALAVGPARQPKTPSKEPWITASYHNMPPKELADRLVDGHWRSGDVTTIDENGFIKITDRLKVSSNPAAGSHPSTWKLSWFPTRRSPRLRSLASSTPKWDERPFMFLVLNGGEGITPEEVDEHLLQWFAEWQVPEEFKVVVKSTA